MPTRRSRSGVLLLSGEDDSTFPVEPPRPPSASGVVPPLDRNLSANGPRLNWEMGRYWSSPFKSRLPQQGLLIT